MTPFHGGFGLLNLQGIKNLEMGVPTQLTRAQEQFLRATASGQPEFEHQVKIGATGRFGETLPLRENDVRLITLVQQP